MSQGQLDTLLSHFSSHLNYNVAVISHHNADPDAFSSSVAISYFLTSLLENVSVTLFFDSLSELTQRFKSSIYPNISVSFNSPSNSFNAIFLCDTNNPLQLGKIDIQPLLNLSVPLFIIDHHSFHPFSDNATFAIIDTSATSTAEIITHLAVKELGFSFPPNIATLLLGGMLFDTRKFTYVSSNTFDTVSALIRMGGDYNLALSLLQQDMSRSERIARLKGAVRSILYKDEKFIFVVSHSSSFESSVARALIDLGADIVAVIARPSSSELRVSLRCRKSFSNSYSLNLGKLCQDLAMHFGGTGGGHQTAAGMNFVDITPFPKDKGRLMKFFQELILNYIMQNSQ